MSFAKTTISSNLDELTFLQTFISAITAANPKITCPTTNLSTQFENTSNTPTFSLVLDGTYTLTFSRDYSLLSSTASYTITLPDTSTVSIYFLDIAANYTDETTRIWRFETFSNAENVGLFLGSRLDYSDVLEFLSIKNTNVTACIYTSSPSYYLLLEQSCRDSNNIFTKKIDRLPYILDSSNTNSAHRLAGKVFVLEGGSSNSNEMVFITEKMHDCSYVPSRIKIQVGTTAYYSLDNYTLIEI